MKNQKRNSSRQPATTNEKRHRQNKKRKLKNSVRKALISLGAFFAVLVLGIVLSLTMFFNITEINAFGSAMYSAEEIERFCGIEIGNNLFLIDTDTAAKQITESLPYIYEVKITKKLPATLNIEAIDATPAFSVKKEDESYIILDDNFKVLESAREDNIQDTVLITDAVVAYSNPGYTIEFENEESAECLLMLANAVTAVEMSEATAISSTDKYNNYVVYDNRITFKLGKCENLETKLYRGLTVCEELNKSNGSIRGSLDLTNDKQYYFTPE